MSEPQTRANRWARLGIALPVSRAVRGYGMLAGAASSLLTLWLLGLGWSWAALLPSALVALALLGTLSFTAGPVILALILVALAADERYAPAMLRSVSAAAPGSAWWVGPVCVTLLIACYRLQAFTVGVFPRATVRVPLRGRRLWHPPRATPAHRRDPGSFSAEETWGVLFWTAFGMAASGALLWILPPEPGFHRLFGLPPGTEQAVKLIWIALLLLVGGGAAKLVFVWRRLTPREAGTFLRGVVWLESRKEQESIARYVTRREGASLRRRKG